MMRYMRDQMRQSRVKQRLCDNPIGRHVLTNEAGFIVSDPWATDSMPIQSTHCAKIFDEFFPKLHQNGSNRLINPLFLRHAELGYASHIT